MVLPLPGWITGLLQGTRTETLPERNLVCSVLEKHPAAGVGWIGETLCGGTRDENGEAEASVDVDGDPASIRM
jgi:hypothetical protein